MMNPEIIEFNNTIFFFDSEGAVCSTFDLQNWNVWTNQFGTDRTGALYTEKVVGFNNAIWAFASDRDSQNAVMRSNDGMSWTKISDGAGWKDLSMSGDVFASDNKLYVSAPDSSAMSRYVWSSTDGISRQRSVLPGSTDSIGSKLVHFNNALWCFVQNSLTMSAEAWKSTNDGNTWSLVTTNLPNYTVMTKFRVAALENNLWLWGQNMYSMDGGVFYSPDGINFSKVVDVGYISESAEVIGLPNGKLWFYLGSDDPNGGPALFCAGGPKKDDGLYYYKKD